VARRTRIRDPRLALKLPEPLPATVWRAYRAGHTALISKEMENRLDGGRFRFRKNREMAVARLTKGRAGVEPEVVEALLGVSVGESGKLPLQRPVVELLFPPQPAGRHFPAGGVLEHPPIWQRTFTPPYEYGWPLHSSTDAPLVTWSGSESRGSFPAWNESASAVDGVIGLAIAGCQQTPWNESWLLGDKISCGAVIQQSAMLGINCAFPTTLTVGADLSIPPGDPGAWVYSLLGGAGDNEIPVLGLIGSYWLSIQILTDSGVVSTTAYHDFLYTVFGPTGVWPIQFAPNTHVSATVNLPPRQIRWVIMSLEADLWILRGGHNLPNSGYGVVSFQDVNHWRSVAPVGPDTVWPVNVVQMTAQLRSP